MPTPIADIRTSTTTTKHHTVTLYKDTILRMIRDVYQIEVPVTANVSTVDDPDAQINHNNPIILTWDFVTETES